MATRDFRESTKQKYLQDVSEICKDQGSGWDNFWDRVDKSRVVGWLINEGIKVFQGQDAYERQLIDINNTTRKQIQQIWTTVNNDASGYEGKISAVGADLEGFTGQLRALTDSLTGESFDSADINGNLKNGMDSYLKISSLYQEIAGDGLKPKDLDNDPALALELFQSIAKFMIDNAPTLKANESWSVPFGPNLLATLALYAELDGNGNLTVTFDEQKTLLKDMVSWGEKGANIKSVPNDTDGWVLDQEPWEDAFNDFRITGILIESWHRTVNGATETITMSINTRTGQVKMSGNVKQDVKNGSASTDVSLQNTENANWPKFPLLPVAETVPVLDSMHQKIQDVMEAHGVAPAYQPLVIDILAIGGIGAVAAVAATWPADAIAGGVAALVSAFAALFAGTALA
ncbi:hypothetical protein OZX72_00120 [Bifidobacterium sp. ESL0769]|uniref:hypothetical protein n=1 Tax=Bifidobacterium sp. ESL0769 TaxID=2983229 RepID=UPI0023F7E8C1|nr:hypothetical protein [Bifidobacterium sp. ESL0769]WEV67461.1 hypothetical protein OZX72_00120 [Bifidobacterium sp. ESL0769]